MEAGLYVPSGSMGNRCALVAHTRPGDEVVYAAGAHVFGGYRAHSAAEACLAARSVPLEFGVMRPEQVEEIADQANPNRARPSLVWIENSHNLSGGSAWLPAQVEALAAAVHKHGLNLHIDGARIFNAAVAVGVDVRAYTEHADSVMFCASKGLSAPVGSLLCGRREFIEQARQVRSRLGGAMRQAGIVAAAAIVAIETMVERLAEDQAHAQLLHEGLADIEGLKSIQPPHPTNFVTVDCNRLGWSSQELVDRWKAYGILKPPPPAASGSPSFSPPHQCGRCRIRPSLYPASGEALKNHLASRSRNTRSLLKKSPTRLSRYAPPAISRRPLTTAAAAQLTGEGTSGPRCHWPVAGV